MGSASGGAGGAGGASLRVAVAVGIGPGLATETTVELAEGATALDALRASGLLDRIQEVDAATRTIGVWGRACATGTLVKDGDRVEVYRPLAMNPNEARRLRAQGRRKAAR